ncbi:hypothetical protein DFH06DRAFT_1335570 [Mycena polygramma]|nr:hypothetical protein DFH06DRAFT_1335570 [Mycena polygramma]
MLSFRKFLEFFHYIDAFRLSHVCADWRQVANGTPQLWTGLVSLVITNRTLAKMHDTRNVDGMKAWLARSAPLAIPVLTSFELEGPDVTLPPVLAEVLKISPRWCSLKMSRWAPASYFTCLAERGLDNLEELDLSLGSDFDYTILPSFSILAPRLRKLHMNSHCRTSMPWAQLTDISLSHGPSPDIALGILAQCPSLVKVDINTVGWSTLPQLGTDVITLQHLRTLLLAFIGSDGPHERHFMPFLERLSAPTLELLNLNIPLPHLIWPRSAFTAFQLLSPNMTQLAIVASDALTSDDLRAALFHASLLTHLTLHHWHSENDFAKRKSRSSV